MIYCTVLNPALDVIYKLDAFHSGSTIIDNPVSMVPAGKGINVARIIKVLGEDVCVTGIIPEYDLKKITSFLDREQISYNFLSIPGCMRINTTIIEQSTGAVSHINSSVADIPSRIQDEYILFQQKMLSQDDTWCFSGSLPKGFDNDVYGKMVKSSLEAGTLALLDSRGDALKFGIRARPAMIKPNLSELEEFFGEQIRGVHHIALKGKRLIDMGISYVFISLGADGMIAIHENDCLLCSAPSVKVVDTVGCGDALVAGLLTAHKRNFSFNEMCRMAIACGTAKALHEGPGVVTRDEVWQLMEDVNITAV